MNTSLLRYVFFFLVISLVFSTIVFFYLSDRQIHSLVDAEQQRLFKERLDIVINLIAESYEKRHDTGGIAYEKELQQAALKRISEIYSSVDLSYSLVISDRTGTLLFQEDYNDRVHPYILSVSLQPLQLKGVITSYETGIIDNFWIIKGTFKPWQWQFFFIAPKKLKNSFAHKLRNRVLLLVMAANIVLLGLASWMIFRIGRPLIELKNAVNDLSEGNFNGPIENALRRKDEIGVLASGFQKMRESVKNQMNLLIKMNTALETQVQERRKTEAKRKETELSYQQIFNASSEAIFIFDMRTGQVLEANDAVVDLFEYSREELEDMTFALLHMGPGRAAYEQCCQLLESVVKEGPLFFEWHCKKKSGEIFPSEACLKGFRVGGEYRVIAVCRDISIRKKNEERQHKIEEQLQRSKKLEALGTLAGGIAHDFNNILTPIIGYTEVLLAQEREDNQIKSGLQVILDASLKARNLVLQILAFSRGEKSDFESINLSKIVGDVVRLMRSSLPSNIKIEDNLIGSDCMVLAESNQLLRIITNLCTNAQQAIKEEGGTINIGIEETDYQTAVGMSGKYVHFWVKDDGPGIANDIIDRIFEPYFTTRKSSKGTGLGLSIVHGIVKNLDGEITVETVENEGTIFHVYLPCSAMKENNRNEIITRDWLQGNNEVILIVDDEENVLKFEKSMFEQLGYQVFSFTEGKKAMQFLKQHYQTVDLVITDIVMPSMSGIQLAEQIKKLEKDIPVILLSGDSALVEEKSFEAGPVVKVIQKPIVLQSFASTVKEALAKSLSENKDE